MVDSWLVNLDEIIENYRRGSGASLPKQVRREAARQRASSLGYGDGRGKDKAALLADYKLLVKFSKIIKIGGPVLDGLLAGGQEYVDQSDESTGERVGRSIIKGTTSVLFGGLGAAGGAAICLPSTAGAVGCGIVGGILGGETGGKIGDTINDWIFGDDEPARCYAEP